MYHGLQVYHIFRLPLLPHKLQSLLADYLNGRNIHWARPDVWSLEVEILVQLVRCYLVLFHIHRLLAAV